MDCFICWGIKNGIGHFVNIYDNKIKGKESVKQLCWGTPAEDWSPQISSLSELWPQCRWSVYPFTSIDFSLARVPFCHTQSKVALISRAITFNSPLKFWVWVHILTKAQKRFRVKWFWQYPNWLPVSMLLVNKSSLKALASTQSITLSVIESRLIGHSGFELIFVIRITWAIFHSMRYIPVWNGMKINILSWLSKVQFI